MGQGTLGSSTYLAGTGVCRGTHAGGHVVDWSDVQNGCLWVLEISSAYLPCTIGAAGTCLDGLGTYNDSLGCLPCIAPDGYKAHVGFFLTQSRGLLRSGGGGLGGGGVRGHLRAHPMLGFRVLLAGAAVFHGFGSL